MVYEPPPNAEDWICDASGSRQAPGPVEELWQVPGPSVEEITWACVMAARRVVYGRYVHQDLQSQSKSQSRSRSRSKAPVKGGPPAAPAGGGLALGEGNPVSYEAAVASWVRRGPPVASSALRVQHATRGVNFDPLRMLFGRRSCVVEADTPGVVL